MRIVVLGGDGFCGWPTALKFVSEGHDVLIIDNLSRRNIDRELDTESIVDIASPTERVEKANELFRGNLSLEICNTLEWYPLLNAVSKFQPDTIVHFAEQRSAPYSMISHKERRYTVENNIVGTHNVLNVILAVNPDIHLVHLGTMGVYGYSKEFGDIPEGYLDVTINQTGESVDILYPTNPGSVYHMTKSLDQILFQFYKKNWGLQITDLHQGIVWGTQTELTQVDPALANRFDYDGIYGTVLNRFIVQAAVGHPLTVYGTGGQHRAFIHIQDTANCVFLASMQPPEPEGKVRIFNQVSEVRGVMELAEILRDQYGAEIDPVPNPRKELAANDLSVTNTGLRSLGFEPVTLNNALIEDCKFIADQVKDRVDISKILNSPNWEER